MLSEFIMVTLAGTGMGLQGMEVRIRRKAIVRYNASPSNPDQTIIILWNADFPMTVTQSVREIDNMLGVK